jgi:hypothetical protein
VSDEQSDSPALEFEAARRVAMELLAAGDPQQAFVRFRHVVWYPAHPPAEQLAASLAVLAAIFDGMGHGELAGEATRAGEDVHDPDALYDLGYALVEAGLPAIAAVVLARCLEVVPGSEQVLTELVSALERNLAYRDAQRLLEAHPQLVETSFLCRYLLAYNAAMAGDLGTTRAHAPRLEPDDEGQRFMAGRIESILGRADQVVGLARLDGNDLRGWHYVLTGGVLTHLSPYGFEDAMRGRYAWLQDSMARVRTGLDRLLAILRAWDIAPPCVYAPPGRDHEIVAHAAAMLLDVPVAPWPAIGVPAPGLVAMYDLTALEWRDVEKVLERRPGQILYAHASPWTEDGPVAADVTTLLQQSVTAPWGDRLVIDAEHGSAGRAGPDERSVRDIAADVIAAAPLEPSEIVVDDVDGAEDAYSLMALVRRMGPPPHVRRERLWAGSPVPSNRFG